MLSFLRQVPLFGCLAEEQLRALAQVASERRFARGELIILAEEEGDALFVIQRGGNTQYMTLAVPEGE